MILRRCLIYYGPRSEIFMRPCDRPFFADNVIFEDRRLDVDKLRALVLHDQELSDIARTAG